MPALLFAWLLPTVYAADQAEAPATYELHEWGVFMVPRNAAWANLDMKGEWSSMPKEFYGRLPQRDLPYRGPVAKPVIYFHAEKPVALKLTIRFADGMPTIWWPAAERPVFSGMELKEDRSVLEFAPQLIKRNEKVLGSPAAANPRKLEVPAGHWVETLRAVQASEVFCAGGWGHIGTSWDTERFIYYDGLMKPPATPGVDRQGARIVLDVPGSEIWQDVLLLERNAGKISVAENWGGWDAALEAGAGRHEIFTLKISDEAGLKNIAKELAKRLAAAGLNKDEADALVKVWEEGIFKQDGLTLLYRVPQATYDKWLPLKAEPAPTKTVRIGLVLQRHLEPELDARVEALIKKLNAEKFEERNAAEKELLQIGGAAFPMLDKGTKSEDAEVAAHCQALLKALDARPLLEKKAPAEK
ncbi:MAG: hypothetical protein HY291_13275 [Planctomycetes bacterium]|nr:hypothetical protein [Planctomycetota bacterium]